MIGKQGDMILDGVTIRCRGCGKDYGVTCVAFPEGFEPPPDPTFPFSEDDCPVCGLRDRLDQALSPPRFNPERLRGT